MFASSPQPEFSSRCSAGLPLRLQTGKERGRRRQKKNGFYRSVYVLGPYTSAATVAFLHGHHHQWFYPCSYIGWCVLAFRFSLAIDWNELSVHSRFRYIHVRKQIFQKTNKLTIGLHNVYVGAVTGRRLYSSDDERAFSAGSVNRNAYHIMRN